MPTMKPTAMAVLKTELGLPEYSRMLPSQATAVLNAPIPTVVHSGTVPTAAVRDLLLSRGRLDKLTTAAAGRLLAVLRDAEVIDPAAAEPAKLIQACVAEASLTADDAQAIRALAPAELGPSKSEALLGWRIYEENVRDALGMSIQAKEA